MEISNDTLTKAWEEAKALLETYQKRISKAYDQQAGEIAVNLSLKFNDDYGKIDTAIGISFVESKVSEKCRFKIDPKQQTLFPISGDLK